ncbi:MAG: glucose-6-phosphate dehydrogenase [Planctomycetes bacterium]|nr:glucose-6-phosphate dehydrogenase [Planctomycetota bacterium]
MSRTQVEPHLIVVFGATGDLFHRKLLPALFRLRKRGVIDGRFRVLGVARRGDLDDASFRELCERALDQSGLSSRESERAAFLAALDYQQVQDGVAASYQALAERIAGIEFTHSLPRNRIFYLSLPPRAFPSTIDGLGEVGLNRSSGSTRLVIEKPFGRDVASAKALNQLLHRWFDESQVYRIDHYLGKETVQNLFVFRFANALFEPVWNRDRIDNVQITVSEELGVESRAGYYEQAGALRDMVQNHLTQLLCLTAMEPPAQFEADAIRNEKVKVLRSIAPIADEDVVFGQYRPGTVEGAPVCGYLGEKGVAPTSTTETFVALRVSVSNWRWQGVPFYLRTGKRMPKRLSQITVSFRCPPVSMFQPFNTCVLSSNQLVITVQPDEGFDLSFEVKAPGEDMAMRSQRMQYRYHEHFDALPDGYETLLADIVQGDQTLFVRADEVEKSWELFTPVLERPRALHGYAAGSWGPAAAEQLVARNEQRWAQR